MSARARIDELLALRAVAGLDPQTQAELDTLLRLHPESRDDDSFDLAAAALDLALSPPRGTLPAGLRARLAASLPEFLGASDSGRSATEPRGGAAPSPKQQRAALGAQPGAVHVPWSATDDPAAAAGSGDVVWSPEAGAGVLRLRGLEPNDPARSQYQIWIFDAARDERYPVDGGVFDVPAGGDEVLVPIDPRLQVTRAQLVVVTVEPPGGVVVSDRERVVLTARVDD